MSVPLCTHRSLTHVFIANLLPLSLSLSVCVCVCVCVYLHVGVYVRVYIYIILYRDFDGGFAPFVSVCVSIVYRLMKCFSRRAAAAMLATALDDDGGTR